MEQGQQVALTQAEPALTQSPVQDEPAHAADRVIGDMGNMLGELRDQLKESVRAVWGETTGLRLQCRAIQQISQFDDQRGTEQQQHHAALQHGLGRAVKSTLPAASPIEGRPLRRRRRVPSRASRPSLASEGVQLRSAEAHQFFLGDSARSDVRLHRRH